MTFSPDSKRLAATGYGGVVKLWDAATSNDALTLRPLSAPTGQYSFTARVIFSGDGSRIAANNWDGTTTIWDARPATP